MSNYCALADLLNLKTATEILQLADLDRDGVADSAVIERVCARATLLINSYVSPRYPLPLTGTALAQVQAQASSLAIYFLQEDRGCLTEDLNAQYKNVIAWLKDVQSGTASLGDPVNASAGDKSPGIQVVAPDRVFTRDKMAGF